MIQKLGLWLFAAAFCFPVYFLANLAELPGWLVLILTFVAAITGSYVGTRFRESRGGTGTDSDRLR